MEKKPEAAQQSIQGEILIRVEQEVSEASAVYRIQVASLSNPEAAEDLKKTLADMFELPVIIRDNPATGTNQVRIGETIVVNDADQHHTGLIMPSFWAM